MSKNENRLNFRMTDETTAKIERWYQEDNCRSKNEFIEKAVNCYADTVRRELEHEQDPRCRVLQEDYLKLIRQLGSREAITRRFFLVFEYAYLARLSEERNMSCIGATNYGSRQITVSSAGATVHEFGHFLDELMGFPSQTEGFYQEESGTAAALLRPYALTNEQEYFADCFVYWLTYRDDSKKMASLCSAAPKTYAYLLALESQNWQPAA